MSKPTILKVTKNGGIAGQVQYTATVDYDGELSAVGFVGSPTYGGPVVMVSEGGTQVFVTDPARFGTFGPAWVRRFFGEEA